MCTRKEEEEIACFLAEKLGLKETEAPKVHHLLTRTVNKISRDSKSSITRGRVMEELSANVALYGIKSVTRLALITEASLLALGLFVPASRPLHNQLLSGGHQPD